MCDIKLGDIFTVVCEGCPLTNFKIVVAPQTKSFEAEKYCLMCLETDRCASYVHDDIEKVYEWLRFVNEGAQIVHKHGMKLIYAPDHKWSLMIKGVITV
ncbi:hypothetical protein MCOL2_05920 [Listeria fleischmannii FSL S10-1203]|uniref:Uncharacterized protein n=2 Tax=Listeria fleischmannii TaxID=1069827 RepID=W7DND3_9LIST|nr:hypothetical protein MCOL2_05920 [Listeria fleischmannii FSL S10-1203]